MADKIKALDAIADFITEDILSMSEEECQAACAEDGDNPEELAAMTDRALAYADALAAALLDAPEDTHV